MLPKNFLLIRNQIRRWHQSLPLHWVLAALVAINGYFILQPSLSATYALGAESWRDWLDLDTLTVFLHSFGLLEIPRVVLGIALQVMALGLIFKARIAWGTSLLLLLSVVVFLLWHSAVHVSLLIYTILLAVVLMVYWRRFDRSSLIAGSIFAALSTLSLLIYAICGSLFLGQEFSPPITDLATAFYFSIVSMSTVGYGDITPQTAAARIFSASVIVLGITVFATSISAIAGSVIGGNIQRLVKGKFKKPMRKNHIIIAGVTPLAQTVYKLLRDRGYDVTVIVPPDSPHTYPSDADLMIGDATDTAVLAEAGAADALYVLALRSDDSDNAFIILAAKELCSERTKTVALVNTATHLKKIKQVNPDVVLSLQSLGAEILSRMVTGEAIDNEMITNLLFPVAAQPAS